MDKKREVDIAIQPRNQHKQQEEVNEEELGRHSHKNKVEGGEDL
jgi:hypothetical protein